MSDDIECELHFVAHANQAVHRRSRFHFEITAVDIEFALSPQVVSRDGHLGRDRDWPRHSMQRQFAADPPGAVLDGRDIGTVICPHADVKIFVVADPKVRARRRTLEARARGEDADEAAVLADILKRDERDQNRAVAPVKPAPDAHLLDNTHLDIEGGVRAAIDIVEAVRAGRQRV